MDRETFFLERLKASCPGESNTSIPSENGYFGSNPYPAGSELSLPGIALAVLLINLSRIDYAAFEICILTQHFTFATIGNAIWLETSAGAIDYDCA